MFSVSRETVCEIRLDALLAMVDFSEVNLGHGENRIWVGILHRLVPGLYMAKGHNFHRHLTMANLILLK
jgi:hypothetical protein